MQKAMVAVLAITLGLLCSFRAEAATSIDTLLDALVEKGVLTRSEASTIASGASSQEEKIDKIYHKIKWKGDLRLRYQYEDLDGDTRARHRERVRFRLAGEAPVTDKVDVGWRIVTGGSGARSTNETLDSTFTTKALDIDWAYAEYAPWDWLTLTGGKFSNKTAVWKTGDVLWDGDLSFEGAALNAEHTFEDLDAVTWWLKAGIYMLEEESGANDPYMVILQPGLSWDIADPVSFKGAVAYYGTPHTKRHAALTGSSGTNSTTGGLLTYEFQVWGVDGELHFELDELMDLEFIPDLILFAQYSQNSDPNTNEDAYQIGGKLGHKKVKKQWQWQIAYNYRHIESDAFLDAFPDSDAYTGDTNVKGSEVIFNLGLLDNVILGLDYYHTKPITGSSAGIEEDLFQADLVFKF